MAAEKKQQKGQNYYCQCDLVHVYPKESAIEFNMTYSLEGECRIEALVVTRITKQINHEGSQSTCKVKFDWTILLLP